MTETSAECVVRLDMALADLDRRLAVTDAKRRSFAVDAASGSKSALQAVAACDAESDKLCRERETFVTALEIAHEQLEAEKRAVTAKSDSERRAKAQAIARNISAFNVEVDRHLEQLATVLEQRFEALRELSATDVVDRSLINKMLGRDPLTRALHFHGLHRHAAVNVGPRQRCRMVTTTIERGDRTITRRERRCD